MVWGRNDLVPDQGPADTLPTFQVSWLPSLRGVVLSVHQNKDRWTDSLRPTNHAVTDSRGTHPPAATLLMTGHRFAPLFAFGVQSKAVRPSKD